MHNKSLTADYIKRAEKRLMAVNLLFREESWADVVRESQEIVELSLKALLRLSNIEVPRIHDVSIILREESSRLPVEAAQELDFLIHASKSLRRDRELAFYGSEDLTPGEFYTKDDAAVALELATKTQSIVAGCANAAALP